MKRTCILTVLALAVNFAVAQDLDEISKLAYLNKHAQAKEAVDKYLAIEKNAKKPEGWFWKGYVINQLSKDSSKTLDESSAMKTEAFETFKKYRQMDAKSTLLEEQNNSPLFDIYSGFASDLAIKAYNAKDLAGAHENFKKGVAVHDYIYANNITGSGGFKFDALDTVLVLYTAITAKESKKIEEAVVFYKILTDAAVAGPDYIDAYQVLADYYKGKKDKAAFEDILAKGRKLYPKNEAYWTAIEIEAAVDGVQAPEIFQKYDELMVKMPDNYTVVYNYGVELFNYLNSDAAKTANTSEHKTKLVEVLKKADNLQPSFDANFLLATFLYNNSFDIGEEARKIKGPKPEDLKRRKAMEADATKSMNEAIVPAEAALKLYEGIEKKKTTDKIHNKQLLTMLKNIYEVKKDTAKAAQYDKLSKEAE
jgi:hypothetical protein